MSLISNFWSFWRSRIFSFSSLADWWDASKAEIKRLSVDYCRNRARVKRGERDLLSRLVSFLKEKLNAGATFCLAPYHTALSNLGKFDLEAARGAQVRGRVHWTEEGKVSSAYFFRLIKKQSADCLVAALHCPDGTVVNSPPELVECFSQFYSDLFSAELVDFAAQDVLLSNVSAIFRLLSVMTVKASCLLRNVLLLFKAWLAGWPPVVMASLWNFILSSGVFLVRIWLEF